jgi:DNA-binding NtrC family response regulator
MASIVVVEDEVPLRQSVVIALKRQGHAVHEAGSLAEAAEALARELFDLAIVDLRLPDGEGLTVLRDVGEARLDTAVVMVSAYGTVEFAVEAMRLGAFDFLEKPFVPERLVTTVSRALDNRRLRAELRRRSLPADTHGIIGRSSAIEQVRRRIRQAASARLVLVSGETGTGKELVARAVHAQIDAAAPFVVVHCGALPEAMIESELFGHVPGAFAGATVPRRGLLREAEGGILFFDEIAEVPLGLQSRLLRFLDQGEVRPVGSDHSARVECRILAATSRDLEDEVSVGRFRGDLMFRLDVFRIAIPPLRDRPEDVLPLCEFLLARLASRLDRPTPRLDPDALEMLQEHPWPGNVRELEHALERAMLLADLDEDLPAELFGPLHSGQHEDEPDPSSLDVSDLRSLAAVEKQHILSVLQACSGDRSRTARTLGISRSTLRRKLITYDLWKYRPS